ncbi:MAG: FAD-dependent oxidoreductase, partial [Proteobacteria bacterium]|nr:FAD-dependent oxidoreductase [Pseudomonadota bacterium]
MSSRSDDRFEGQAMTEHVVIVGAGIVGVSAALWLRRFSDAQVTRIDRLDPGEGTS